MTIPAAILLHHVPATQWLVGGLPLLTRQLKELRNLGVKECYLLGFDAIPSDVLHRHVPDDMVCHSVPCTLENLPQTLGALPGAPRDLILLRGEWLIDPRLLAILLATPKAQQLPPPDSTTAILPVAARLTPAVLDLWSSAGLPRWLAESAVLELAILDPYSPAHRGPKPFYYQAVTSSDDATVATQTLIAAAQKSTLDLPALLLHPIFENRLVAWLCNTPVTPNHVTLLTAALGGGVAVLFLNGWLRLGILLALVVGVLDGVDGKLARTRLQTSRLGEVEHVIDFFVEQAWYLSLTRFLVTSTGTGAVWWLGAGLMLCDLGDKLLYLLGHRLFGKQLDELGSFDRRFRLIGGRRNIYVWIFLCGFWTGFAVQAVALALIWALVTVGVHSARLAWIFTLSYERRPSPRVSPKTLPGRS